MVGYHDDQCYDFLDSLGPEESEEMRKSVMDTFNGDFISNDPHDLYLLGIWLASKKVPVYINSNRDDGETEIVTFDPFCLASEHPITITSTDGKIK
jgi:hypothetical protein